MESIQLQKENSYLFEKLLRAIKFSLTLLFILLVFSGFSLANDTENKEKVNETDEFIFEQLSAYEVPETGDLIGKVEAPTENYSEVEAMLTSGESGHACEGYSDDGSIYCYAESIDGPATCEYEGEIFSDLNVIDGVVEGTDIVLTCNEPEPEPDPTIKDILHKIRDWIFSIFGGRN